MRNHIIVIGIAIMFVGGVFAYDELNTLEVYKEEAPVEVEPEPEPEPEPDVLEAAKSELQRINTELDAEEQRLLQEKEAIEKRLDAIRETRASFQ